MSERESKRKEREIKRTREKRDKEKVEKDRERKWKEREKEREKDGPLIKSRSVILLQMWVNAEFGVWSRDSCVALIESWSDQSAES